MEKAWINCTAEECRNLKEGHCSLDEIRIDTETGDCLSADYPENAGCICDDCRDGYEKDCPHASGRHYDVYGEGIEPPDWCPQHTDDLPF